LSRNIPNPYATMKYPCIRYIRRKKSSNVILNNIQRGTTWIVDLSSQYCTARRTKVCWLLFFGKWGKWNKKNWRVRERRQIIKREMLPLFPLLFFSSLLIYVDRGAEDVIGQCGDKKINIGIIAENQTHDLRMSHRHPYRPWCLILPSSFY
jgi:hypothetical protein